MVGILETRRKLPAKVRNQSGFGRRKIVTNLTVATLIGTNLTETTTTGEMEPVEPVDLAFERNKEKNPKPEKSTKVILPSRERTLGTQPQTKS